MHSRNVESAQLAPLMIFISINGVVIRGFASQSVNLGFISQVESYQKTLKNVFHTFPAWRSAQKGWL